MRLTCAGVNLGNIFSRRELVIGSPLRVLDIVVIYSVVAAHKSSLESFRLSLSEKEYGYRLMNLIELPRRIYTT